MCPTIHSLTHSLLHYGLLTGSVKGDKRTDSRSSQGIHAENTHNVSGSCLKVCEVKGQGLFAHTDIHPYSITCPYKLDEVLLHSAPRVNPCHCGTGVQDSYRDRLFQDCLGLLCIEGGEGG